MEFLDVNLFQTTTAATVNSNTATVESLLRRDKTYQYISSGFNNDATTVSLTITLTAAAPVSRIALDGHNLKSYTIFYDGVTANTFSMTSTADTTTSDYSSNSSTAQCLVFNTQTVSSITIDMKSTMVANAEKAIGYIHMSDTKLVFDRAPYERVPSAKDYKPRYISKEVVHKMSDGGRRIHYVDNKYSTKIKLKYIEENLRDALYDVWFAKSEFVFSVFPTSAGWTGIIHTVVWDGAFDFYKYSDNAASSGFSGTISLSEVS